VLLAALLAAGAGWWAGGGRGCSWLGRSLGIAPCCATLTAACRSRGLPRLSPTPLLAARGINAQRHKRERALLAGCCVGGAAASVAFPFAEAALGPAGAVAAAGVLLANTLAGARRGGQHSRSGALTRRHSRCWPPL
jgi:hypothetical protein